MYVYRSHWYSNVNITNWSLLHIKFVVFRLCIGNYTLFSSLYTRCILNGLWSEAERIMAIWCKKKEISEDCLPHFTSPWQLDKTKIITNVMGAMQIEYHANWYSKSVREREPGVGGQVWLRQWAWYLDDCRFESVQTVTLWHWARHFISNDFLHPGV